jgi:hypothetical protein
MNWIRTLPREPFHAANMVVSIGALDLNRVGGSLAYTAFCFSQPEWGKRARISDLSEWVCIPPVQDCFYGVNRSVDSNRLAGFTVPAPTRLNKPVIDLVEDLQNQIVLNGGNPDVVIQGCQAPMVITRDNQHGPAMKVERSKLSLGADIYVLQSDTWGILDGYSGSQLYCLAPGFNGRILAP